MAQNDIPFFKKPLPNLSQQAYGYNPYGIGGAFGKTIRDLAFAGYKKKQEEQAAEKARQQQVNLAAAQQMMVGQNVGLPGVQSPQLSDIQKVVAGQGNPLLTKPVQESLTFLYLE